MAAKKKMSEEVVDKPLVEIKYQEKIMYRCDFKSYAEYDKYKGRKA